MQNNSWKEGPANATSGGSTTEPKKSWTPVSPHDLCYEYLNHVIRVNWSLHLLGAKKPGQNL